MFTSHTFSSSIHTSNWNWNCTNDIMYGKSDTNTYYSYVCGWAFLWLIVLSGNNFNNNIVCNRKRKVSFVLHHSLDEHRIVKSHAYHFPFIRCHRIYNKRWKMKWVKGKLLYYFWIIYYFHLFCLLDALLASVKCKVWRGCEKMVSNVYMWMDFLIK